MELFTANAPGSVVVNNNYGSILTTIKVPLAAADAVSAPAGLVRLPKARDRAFVGREQELWQLHATLTADVSDGVSVVVVHGLGGIGKSSLAMEYARRHRNDFNPVVWLPSETPTRLAAGLAELADDLHPPLRISGASLAQRANWARSWLQSHTGWLLILDDAAEPSDLDDLVGPVGQGCVLVTTRRAAGWDWAVRDIRVDALSVEVSVELLMNLLDDETSAAPLRDIATETGGLPLALEQAAAFLNQTRVGTDKFVQMLRRTAREVLVASDHHRGDDERTIANILQHTLRVVNEENPHAVHLLRVLAWFGADRVPRTLLEPLRQDVGGRAGWHLPLRATGRRLVRNLGWVRPRKHLARRSLSELEMARALRVLRAYSLITLDQESVSVHRLLQAVARTSDPTAPQRSPREVRSARREAQELILHAVTENDQRPAESWETWQGLLPHVEAFLNAHPPSSDRAETAAILGRVIDHMTTGISVSGASHAVRHAERALAICRKRVLGGRLHPLWSANRVRLAEALRVNKELDRAIAVLEDSRYLWGGSQTRAALATCYLEGREPERAIPLLVDEIADHTERFGWTHRRTLYARSNIAWAHGQSGNTELAATLGEEILWDAISANGESDELTLLVRSNLASSYLGLDALDRALSMLSENVRLWEAAFGPRHPAAATNRYMQALTLGKIGLTEQAIALLDRNVTLATEYYQRDHPEVIAWNATRAELLLALGDLERALSLHSEVVATSRRAYGSDHPATLELSISFGDELTWNGYPQRATPILEEILSVAERSLGDRHFLTLAAKGVLSVAVRRSGDVVRAVSLSEVVAYEFEEVYGASHPMTFHRRITCANVYRKSGDVQRAESLLEEILVDANVALRPHHPVLLSARREMAQVAAAKGERTRAGAILKSLLAECEAFRHPRARVTMQVRRLLDTCEESV